MGEFIGHLHPLIVHLPIGILSLAFLIELAGRREAWSYLHESLPFILSIAFLSAIVSVATGWLIPKEGIYNEDLVSLHFWFAIGLTVSIAGLYLLNKSTQASLKKLYFPSFILSMILLTLTGHYGGSMTHGSDYLWSTTASTSTAIKKVNDVNTLVVYSDIIKPIFESKCFKCHNDEKQKGKLNMSTIANLTKGGEGGAVFVKGNIEESALITRAHLPIEDEKHMPPEGKPQLTRQEIKLIEWWIEEGVDFEAKVGEIRKSKNITTILEKYKDNAPYYGDQEINTVSLETLNKIQQEVNVSIISSSSSPLLSVSFARDSSITSRRLKALKAIKDNINELDLSKSNTDDKILSHVRLFQNLQKLKLGGTSITSNGLKVLEDLPHLTTLDVHNTKVDNTALAYISNLGSLTQLYAWQSNLDLEENSALKNKNTTLAINVGVENELFDNAQLLSPQISGTENIFKDSIEVSLNYNFDKAKLTYTLDGSAPHINSQEYVGPFTLNQTAQVRAAAFLEGWESSVPSENTFIKATYSPISAKLNKAPNDQYKASGSTSLIDFKKGTIDFRDGQWLGYQAQDITATIDLGSVESVQNVAVGALESTSSYIFYPKKIMVQSSATNSNFKEIAELDIPTAKEGHDTELKSFLLSFDKHDAQYIKVIIKSTMRNPEWHPAPGAKSWVFIDEILIN